MRLLGSKDKDPATMSAFETAPGVLDMGKSRGWAEKTRTQPWKGHWSTSDVCARNAFKSLARSHPEVFARPGLGGSRSWLGYWKLCLVRSKLVRTLDPNLVGQVGPPQTARLVGPTFGLTKKATGYWMWMSGKNEG